jgi:hypothetical protein
MKVKITGHAYERWNKYIGYMKRTKLAALVERHLYAALRQGAEVKNDAIQLEIFHNLNAVVTPEYNGVWSVVTFYQTEKEVIHNANS